MGGRGPPLATLEKLELDLGSNSSGFTRSRSLAKPTRIFLSAISALEGSETISKNLMVREKRSANRSALIKLERSGCLKHAARMIRFPH